MNTALLILQACQEKLPTLQQLVSMESQHQRLEEIDAKIASPGIWSDPKGAAALMKERQQRADIIEKITYFKEQVEFYTEVSETIPQDLNSSQQTLDVLLKEISEFEFRQMMKDPVDKTAAILTISAGAGGLEAANWVTMLLRMYVRYADCYKFNMEILDMNRSEEHSSICTDSVSIRLEGPYAFGFFKGESGVHRLIRNSPFNSGDARHTSFAAVSVTPDIEDTIDIKIEDKDIDVVATTAGGPGGQNSNKVCSAIRLRHFPSGINIFVRTERDQLANKKTAFKMLRAKLYDIEMKKKQEEKDKHIDSMSDVSFGSQIRTYTETPYSLVKDHRTEYEIKNFDQVLDGDIHQFLLANLRRPNEKFHS
jgi:peptide chain release factor 2